MVGVDQPRARVSDDPDAEEPDHRSPPTEAVALSDAAHVRAVLIAAARQRQAMSYAELLAALGHPFTRPRMRALCRTLDSIDEASRAAGEPDLAVLVVRQSDGLPGQGWWVGTRPSEAGYAGPWTGPDALAFVREAQARAFRFWAHGERT